MRAGGDAGSCSWPSWAGTPPVARNSTLIAVPMANKRCIETPFALNRSRTRASRQAMHTTGMTVQAKDFGGLGSASGGRPSRAPARANTSAWELVDDGITKISGLRAAAQHVMLAV